MSSVSVVIPSWNVRELLRACLRSLERSTRPPEQTIVVENASADGSAEMVEREFPRVTLVRNARNEGFTRATNQGLALARGELALLLNADTELAPDALETLARFLETHDDYAGAAPRLVDPDGATQRACMRFPGWRTPLFFGTPLERWMPRSRELGRYLCRDFDHASDRDVEQPPAACWLLRRSALERVDPLDERMWLFFSDVDLALRLARNGARTRFLAAARVTHHRGASTRQFADFVPEWHSNRLAYYRKHFGRAAGWWVKACTLLAWADFAGGQLSRRARGASAERIGPTTRALGRFLAR